MEKAADAVSVFFPAVLIFWIFTHFFGTILCIFAKFCCVFEHFCKILYLCIFARIFCANILSSKIVSVLFFTLFPTLIGSGAKNSADKMNSKQILIYLLISNNCRKPLKYLNNFYHPTILLINVASLKFYNMHVFL